MSVRRQHQEGKVSAPVDLLNLALSRPGDAAESARALLGAQPSDFVASIAHQALGIVLRDAGDVTEAVHHLNKALTLARRSGDRQREVDVAATLGAAYVVAGRTERGLAVLDAAASVARGETLARLRMRRAFLLRLLGRHADAHAEIQRALAGIRRSGDRIWEGRALNSRALIFLAMGQVERADRDVRRAAELFQETGQELESVFATHTRGFIAYSRNDIPGALDLLDAAADGYDTLGASAHDLAIDRSMVLLTAGLSHEAVEVLTEAVKRSDAASSKHAELLLLLAQAQLANRVPADAETTAQRAAEMFRRQRRESWAARARLIQYQARFATRGATSALGRRAAEVARHLQAESMAEACQAYLLAGRAHLAAGRRREAREHLAAAAAYRHSVESATRVAGWLAQALLMADAGRPGGAAVACARGLDAVDALRADFGSLELRMTGGVHGAELADLGMRLAMASPDPRRIMRWVERWRATALKMPPVRTSHDAELARGLAAVRASARTLHDARRVGAPSERLMRDHSRLERAVNDRQRRLSGVKAAADDVRRPGSQSHPLPPRAGRFDSAELLESLDGRTLVELVEYQADLFALVARHGRVTRLPVGPTLPASGMTEFARTALRQLSIGPTSPLGQLHRRLEASLLGSVGDLLSEEPVIIVPPPRFSSVPWPYLPSLGRRPVSVAPSAQLWMRAAKLTAPRHRRVVLVAGPGLRGADRELDHLRGVYPGAVVIRGADATVERVLGAIDGAWLVHVAAHGRFRSDAPLFSSLLMHDGPMTVHDLQRLRRTPYRFIVSACESGLSVTPADTHEVMGLASALVALGSAGVLSAVTDVNDLATVDLMVNLHAALNEHDDLPTAALHGRLRARGTVAEVPSVCFVPFGR